VPQVELWMASRWTRETKLPNCISQLGRQFGESLEGCSWHCAEDEVFRELRGNQAGAAFDERLTTQKVKISHQDLKFTRVPCPFEQLLLLCEKLLSCEGGERCRVVPVMSDIYFQGDSRELKA
jgi:hypothetical protein